MGLRSLFSTSIEPVRGALLRDGRALIVGGRKAALLETTTPLDVPGPAEWLDGPALVATRDGGALLIAGSSRGKPLTNCVRFDASTATWSPAPRLNTARHYFTAVALDDRVLVMGKGATESLRTGASAWEPEPLPEFGGDWFSSVVLRDGSVLLNSTEGTRLLTPRGQDWTVATGPNRKRTTLVALAEGGALVCGGSDSAQVDRLTPEGQWLRSEELPEPRDGAIGVQLADGRVLLAGGSGVRDATEDDSDGGELDLEYRTVGTVRWVKKSVALTDGLFASPGQPWKREYLSTELEGWGFPFGGGALLVSSRSARLWLP